LKCLIQTGAPGAIIILNKNKRTERKGKVFFINASKEYQRYPEVRKLNQLGDEHIKKIVNAYKEFRNEEGFSKAIGIEKIKENDYNLNVTLYVFPEEETEEIDVAKKWEELRKIEGELQEVEEKIEGYLRELREG